MSTETFEKVFYRFSRQKYAGVIDLDKDIIEKFNIAKESSEGGYDYEFHVNWYSLCGEDAAKVEVFCDAFKAFEEDQPLFKELAKRKDITPDEFHLLLLKLGYQDCSDSREVPEAR